MSDKAKQSAQSPSEVVANIDPAIKRALVQEVRSQVLKEIIREMSQRPADELAAGTYTRPDSSIGGSYSKPDPALRAQSELINER